ncbi:MAG: hypothetical protein IJ600_10095 [Lachnospiraceae bacterium]|nr:hypothetical protein [Lachnospiraceae bacterium]
MNGFYSLWSAPYFLKKPKTAFMMQDFDLITLLLSVAAFEKYNGQTKMYADEAALAYLKERSLEKIFSRGVELLSVPGDIDPAVFWAAGKLCALQMEQMPCVMIDTDLIIWQSIGKTLRNKQVAVIHREELNPEIYPAPEHFQMQQAYQFPAGWDFRVQPANTALLYLKDAAFRDAYVAEALRFMHSLAPTTDHLCPMVFAEQRILPMCAQARGLHIYAFCDRMEQLREQNLFTHIWGHKNVLKFNMDERRAFIRRCLKRLQREFPQMYETAMGLAEFQEVF